MVARLPVAVYVKLTGVSPGLERERSRHSRIGDDSSATFYASAEIGKSSIVEGAVENFQLILQGNIFQ